MTSEGGSPGPLEGRVEAEGKGKGVELGLSLSGVTLRNKEAVGHSQNWNDTFIISSWGTED